MSKKYVWAFGGGALTVLGWPVIKAVLYVILATLTALFGALTQVTTPVQKPPETTISTTAPAQVSHDTQVILNRFDQERDHRDRRDNAQDQNIKEQSRNIKDLGQRVERLETGRPAPTSSPCVSNCGGEGTYMEIPQSR